MNNEVVLDNKSELAIEKAKDNNGDINTLTAVERKLYYLQMCNFYKFDWRTFPFDYIENDGKLKLYINQTGCSQLRDRYQISTFIKSREIIENMWIVVVEAKKGSRIEEATGAASIIDKYGKSTPQLKVNALKKAETQARRRATLAICGFSETDEDQGRIMQSATYDPPMDVIDVSVGSVGSTISDQQVKDLWSIARKDYKLSDDDVKQVLAKFNLESTRSIPTTLYDAVITELGNFSPVDF